MALKMDDLERIPSLSPKSDILTRTYSVLIWKDGIPCAINWYKKSVVCNFFDSF